MEKHSDHRLRRRSVYEKQSQREGSSFYYMDSEAQRKEVSNDLARESLIAISNFVPDYAIKKEASPPESPGNAKGAAVTNGDATEKYRSELISISYTQSPDARPQPAAMKREG